MDCAEVVSQMSVKYGSRLTETLNILMKPECLECGYLMNKATKHYRCNVVGSCPAATLSDRIINSINDVVTYKTVLS